MELFRNKMVMPCRGTVSGQKLTRKVADLSRRPVKGRKHVASLPKILESMSDIEERPLHLVGEPT